MMTTPLHPPVALPPLAQQWLEPPIAVLLVAGAAAVLLVGGIIARVLINRRQRRESLDLVNLQQTLGFEAVEGQDELAQVAQRVQAVFQELAMYARLTHVAGALRSRRDGYTLEAVHVVLGLDASNANHTTLDKLVLIAYDLSHELPQFTVTPNHPLFQNVHPHPVFNHTGRFGSRNLVLGEDRYFIAHVFSERVRQELADNRDLVIESADGTLAFYLHNERIQPPDVTAFVAHVETLIGALVDNASNYTPPPRPSKRDEPVMPEKMRHPSAE